MGSQDLVLEGFLSRKVGNKKAPGIYMKHHRTMTWGSRVYCSTQMDHEFFSPFFGLMFNPPKKKLLNFLRFSPLEPSLPKEYISTGDFKENWSSCLFMTLTTCQPATRFSRMNHLKATFKNDGLEPLFPQKSLSGTSIVKHPRGSLYKLIDILWLVNLPPSQIRPY